MGTRLAGGCHVSGLREGAPRSAATLRTWPIIGRATGAERVSLRTLEFAAGDSPGLRSASDDIWYVLDGEATLALDGQRHEIGPGTGIYIAPGIEARLHVASGQLVVASARCPEPDADGEFEVAPPTLTHQGIPPLVRIHDRPRASTGDRWYVELVNATVGCRNVTQFVGSIPPGRAPDHFHHYEEVIVILSGRGTAWAGKTHAPIEAGSCIYLPRKQVHCLENTGSEPLQLVGIFHPAGSPAVRYEVESTDSPSTEAGSHSAGDARRGARRDANA